MSVLAWIFGLGGLAIALPFLLHLVRQQPKNRTEFSSLMFLKATPPRLTEKKRLQNILLLMLRMLAIALIAFAFMRPLFRSSDSELLSQTTGREILVLVDASASMQRDGLKDQAIEKLKEFAAGCESSDQLALLAFDSQSRWLVRFSDDPKQSDFAGQLTKCVAALKNFEFGYQEFPIGMALGYAAEELVTRNENRSEPAKQQIVLITDQQQSPSINDLSAIQWDESIMVTVLPATGGQANATVVNALPDPEQPGQFEVRVSNHGSTGATEFRYQFFNSLTTQTTSESQSSENNWPGFYVANNKTETLSLPPPGDVVNAIRIANDAFDYDNTYYFTKPAPQHVHLVCLTAGERDDPNGLSFYLPKCFSGVPGRRVTLSEQFEATNSSSTVVVVNRALTEQENRLLDAHLSDGGNVIVCLDETNTTSLARLAGVETAEFSRGEVDDYQMLVDIDFSHPIFVAFAQPGLSDFSDIKFWRTIDCELREGSKRLASFDDGKPAIWYRKDQPDQSGTVVAMASDWRPDISQLALSVKFPILINEFVSWSCPVGMEAETLQVGQPIALPETDADIYVTTPNGDRQLLEAGLELFRETNMPGIYRVNYEDQIVEHAVNISPNESLAACYEQEQLESLGVSLGIHDSKTVQAEVLKRKADLDIESRQKAWKWILCFAVVVLVLETLYAARSPGTATVATGS